MSNEEVNYKDYHLYLETVHSKTLKDLSAGLKDLVDDVNITFNTDSFSILRMNEGRTLLVYLKMIAEKFDDYYIQEPFVAGVSSFKLYKCLSTIDPQDVVRFIINRSDPNTMIVVISNAERGRFAKLEIPLLDINEDDISVPDIASTFKVMMDPNDFQKITRDMKSLNVEMVKITYSKNNLKFTGNGDIPIELVRQPGKDKLEITVSDKEDQANPGIFQGIFELDKMAKFTKFGALSEGQEMLLMNDYPLVVSYHVGCLGEIKLCLAPGTPEN